MEMSLGSTVFLRLDGFTPEWRQGILVFSDKRGRYHVFAVRASNSELVAREADFTSFEVDGDKHILVEGSKDKTRSQCPFPHAAIEVEYAKVLKRATEVMGQEDIQYATASEGLDEANPRRGKKSAMAMPSTTLDLDSGTSEDSGESGEDDVVKLLRRAGKGYVEKDMPSGSQERITKRGKRDRYPLLQKTKSQSVSTKLDVDEVMQSVLVKGNADSNPLNTLVQLEQLKELRGRKGKKESKPVISDQSASSSQESSSESGEKLKGAGKALRAFRRGKRAMRRRPERHIRRYIQEVEDQLGVSKDSSYLLTDYTRKLAWGKHRTLMRVHFALSHLLQTLLKGNVSQGALEVTQLLRAVHQCALDQGEWKTAWLLLDLADPLEKPRFGGEAQQLELVASYVRAMADLEKKNRNNPNEKGDDETAGKGKGAGEKNGKKAEKPEE